jgi:hypothetical protein
MIYSVTYSLFIVVLYYFSIVSVSDAGVVLSLDWTYISEKENATNFEILAVKSEQNF